MSLLVDATDSKNSSIGQDPVNADNHNPSAQDVQAFENFLNGPIAKGLDFAPN